MNYQQILERSSKVLKTHDIKNSNLDSELILTKALNKTREQILTNFNNKITQKQIVKDLFLGEAQKGEQTLRSYLKNTSLTFNKDQTTGFLFK